LRADLSGSETIEAIFESANRWRDQLKR